MAIRVLPKRTATSIRRVTNLLDAQRIKLWAAKCRYGFVCLIAFGLVMAAFFAGLNRIQENDHHAAAACFDHAHAAYVQGAYIAGQLTTLCLEYMTVGTDQPKLLPLSVSGF